MSLISLKNPSLIFSTDLGSTWCTEIFPISLRGIAIPLFALLTSIVSYLVQMFFPWQLATMGISSTLLFYAITVIIGLVVMYKFLIETKGQTIEEIQESLKVKS